VLNGGAARVLKFQSAKIYTLSGSNDAAFYWIDKVKRKYFLITALTSVASLWVLFPATKV